MSAPETLKEPEALREEVRPLPPAEAASAADGTLPPLPEASAVSELLPEGMGLDVLRSGRIVPLRVEDGVLIVGASELAAWPRAQMLGVALGFPVDLELRTEKEVSDLLHTLYDLRSVAADEAAKRMEGIDDIDDLSREDVLSDSVDVPVIRLVNGLFVDALRQRATDIHVEPYEDEVLVRFRVDGVLQDRLRLPRTHQAPLTSRIKVMAKMDIAEHMAPQDGRIGITLGDRAVDIRVGLVPTQHGERMAMRLLDKGHGLLTLEDLGMEENERAVLEGLIRRPHGLGKIDEPLRHPSGAGAAGGQHHHGGGPGGVRAARRGPDPGEREGGRDLRLGAALHPASGPGHRHDRGDARLRDGAHRRAGVPDRAPGALDAPHERLHRGDRPSGGHGHRALPGGQLHDRSGGPAPGAPPLSPLHEGGGPAGGHGPSRAEAGV